MIFASKHSFNLEVHTRRDDLISLGYLLLYLIDGDLAFLTNEVNQKDNKQQGFEKSEFLRLRHLKNTLTPEDLCKSDEAKTLLKFVKLTQRLQVTETPNYEKLRGYLLRQLRKQGSIFNNVYDWNEKYCKEDVGKVKVKTTGLKDHDIDMDEEDFDQNLKTYEFKHNDNFKVMQKVDANDKDLSLMSTKASGKSDETGGAFPKKFLDTNDGVDVARQAIALSKVVLN